jgi:hypothetical protein
LSDALATLRQTEGLPEKAELLKAMFGERVTNVVVEDYYKRMTEGRKQGEFSTARGAGVIATSDTARGEKIPYNNHHGG